MQHNQPVPPFAIFDDYRPTVAMAVAVRWVLLLAWFFLNNYRVELDAYHTVLNLLGAGLAALNAYMTWRVFRGGSITWRHACALSTTDLTVITAGLFLAGGISNDFYVFYYPALLGFSLMFPRRVSFGVAGVVAALYVVMAFTVPPPLARARVAIVTTAGLRVDVYSVSSQPRLANNRTLSVAAKLNSSSTPLALAEAAFCGTSSVSSWPVTRSRTVASN